MTLAGLPLVPSFQVNELISIDKYLRSAGLLLRQVSRKKNGKERERESMERWSQKEREHDSAASTSSLSLSHPPSHPLPTPPLCTTNRPTGRRLPPRWR